ncbi:MAG: hypothetical protein HQ553_04605 [Chloroflexi bacterium]|nr:hypothetical protein [Chloroflexota bacterium]
METTQDFIVAINTIEIDPNLSKGQLKQAIEAQVRDLISKYRGEPLKE